jgi:hypothetical protein
MSNKKEVDVRVYKAGLGLAALVAAVCGVGWWRSRADKASARTIVEDSVYRGFTYRIEQWPFGEGHAFVGVVPIQDVGSVSVSADEGSLLASVDAARTWVHLLIDGKLNPRLRAVAIEGRP